ncbi:MAG TPA: hypothetical protein VF665_25710 [Longimicrobium sp.]|jgi:hypothetical protein|uniref:hypothetical protein n=1 Tax=Longimicrobium sp. TaxID=2029185 RepID=UPI002ED82F84
MPANPQKVALYCQGTFDIANPTQEQWTTMEQAAADIAASGFGTVLLGQWHVHEDGTIYYNDAPIDGVLDTLQTIVPALKAQGNVQTVLISFGPFWKDFDGIQNNLETFKAAMASAAATVGADGFDWDLEEVYDPYGKLLVELTQWANGLGLMVTAAPYQDSGFWQGVLQQTNGGNAAGFAWWNLQLYGGATYSDWPSVVQGTVPNPQAFIVPGYKLDDTSPQDMQAQLAVTQTQFPQLEGAFIWRYEDIARLGYTTAQCAQAIFTGLGGARRGGAREIQVHV